MLIQSRIDSDTIRMKNVINSIGVIIGKSTNGTDFGANIWRNSTPLRANPMIITPKITIEAIIAFGNKWLVNVNIPGIKPNKLPNNKNRKIDEISGTINSCTCPNPCNINPSINWK